MVTIWPIFIRCLDHFRGLDRHLVCQLCHRDGFRHVHLDHARFDWRLRLVFTLITVVATTALRPAAPTVAANATTAVTTGLDFFLLARITSPAGRQLGRLDFLVATRTRRRCRRIGGASTTTRTGRTGGLVQCSLDASLGISGLGRRLRLFGLLGHKNLLGGGHHRADGSGFGLSLAATLAQVGGAGCLFLCSSAGLGFSLLTCSGGSGTCCRGGFGLLLAGHFLFSHGLGPTGFFLGSVGGGTLFGFALTTFQLFAFTTLGCQFGFLMTDLLRLTAGFFLTSAQVGVVGSFSGCRLHFLLHHCGRFRAHVFFALDERALLAHFHLDGACLASGIGLLDFAGRLLDERDLLAIHSRGAVACLQKTQQLLLVGLGQVVGRGALGNARRAKLLEQGFRGLLEFVSELGDSGT